eukprot:1292421-Pyramimonas_sp.AAC.1
MGGAAQEQEKSTNRRRRRPPGASWEPLGNLLETPGACPGRPAASWLLLGTSWSFLLGLLWPPELH